MSSNILKIMNLIYTLLFSLIFLIPNSYNTKRSSNKTNRSVLTCYGNTPCVACKSCNYCKWCTSGGTCGICNAVKAIQQKGSPLKNKRTTLPLRATASEQCTAVTKAGTRCKRSARTNGLCWQHGG